MGKLKEAGKYGFCRLKAKAKTVKTESTPDYSYWSSSTYTWAPNGAWDVDFGDGVVSAHDKSAFAYYVSCRPRRLVIDH